MNKSLITYDMQGRIIQTMSGPEYLLGLPCGDGLSIIEGVAHWDTHYVDRGTDDVVILTRPINTATMNGMVLENLPTPCTISINGTDYACTEPTVSLDFPNVGKYTIVVKCFPYLDKEFVITK